jgi:hypothetical protein
MSIAESSRTPRALPEARVSRSLDSTVAVIEGEGRQAHALVQVQQVAKDWGIL